MNKNFKLSLVLMLVIALVSLAAFVSAASDNYEIEATYISGIELDPNGDTAIDAELGDEITVKVELYGEETGAYVDDVKVKAWIGGYEYGDMEDATGNFDVEQNVTYIKSLDLELPNDLDVCIEEEDYDDCTFTLYVEVYDDDDYERQEYILFLERPRHNVDIMDVLFDSSVEADSLVEVEVRLENLGESKEEDLKVTVSLPELGVSESTYMDELAAPELDNEDEESSESISLYLDIPEDALEGYYELDVFVEYNRGHDDVSETDSIYIVAEEVEVVEQEEEEEEEESGEAEVTVNVEVDDMSVEVGEAGEYTVKFMNTGETTEVYTVDILGEDQWGTSEVEPSVVLVKAGETEEVTVYVTPEEEGEFTFTLQILDADDNLVAEEDVELTAEASANVIGNVGDGDSNWLKILFIVVVVIIIIIILIVAFRKMGDDDDDDMMEPKEGQTYY